jgi:hypothetical protein
VGIGLPIASRSHGVLAGLGELSILLSAGRAHLKNYGSLWRSSASLNWQLSSWLRFDGGLARERRAPDLNALEAPVVSYPNYRVFDPLREETVDVTYVTGGNPGLLAAMTDTTRFAVGAALWAKYNLQLQAEYTATHSRNQLGTLPATSALVLAAFPDRFVRDASGRLIEFDARPANFASETFEQLHYSVGFSVPLFRAEAAVDESGRPTPPRAGQPGRSSM